MSKIDHIDFVRPHAGDVVIFYFNLDEMDVEEAKRCHDELQTNVFPNNTVIGLPDITQLIGCNKEDFLKAIMDILREMFPGKDVLPYIENDFELLLSDEDDENLH